MVPQTFHHLRFGTQREGSVPPEPDAGPCTLASWDPRASHQSPPVLQCCVSEWLDVAAQLFGHGEAHFLLLEDRLPATANEMKKVSRAVNLPLHFHWAVDEDVASVCHTDSPFYASVPLGPLGLTFLH